MSKQVKSFISLSKTCRATKDPEKTQEILKDGWIYSGDKGKIDENGSLHIVGRVEDAFKTEKGKYITPNPMKKIY